MTNYILPDFVLSIILHLSSFISHTVLESIPSVRLTSVEAFRLECKDTKRNDYRLLKFCGSNHSCALMELSLDYLSNCRETRYNAHMPVSISNKSVRIRDPFSYEDASARSP